MEDTETKLEQQQAQAQEESKPVIKTAQIDNIQKYVDQAYDFRFNTITQTLEYKEKRDQFYLPFQEKQKTDIIIQLKRQLFKKPKEDLDDLLNSSLIREYNPIRDYFDGLEHDGRKHIAKLANCITLDDPDKDIGGYKYRDLFNHYFKQWLMACYLCSTGRIVNDVMMILIGAQGRFKTSFLNYLTPKDLQDYRVCSHINPSLTDYNTSNFLAEKFFINVDDQMETIFGKDYNSMKAIISAPDITNRKLYRATHQRRRRIANFCGSVNEPRFLKDSNNRRYLCFAITDISPEYINIDIDAVWAEVKAEADSLNRLYIFGKEDYRMIDLMNTQFEAPTEEDETLRSVLVPVRDGVDPMPNKPIYYVTFSEIMKILRMDSGNNQLRTYNLQTAMRKYGYEPHSYRKERFANQPRNLYPVQSISTSPLIYNTLELYL